MTFDIITWFTLFSTLTFGQIYLELERVIFLNFSFIMSFFQLLFLYVINNFITISFSTGSGILVGFSLGLIGGGGSILAVPLLIYVIGLDAHMAIGTSAFAVAVNALINFLDHKKKGHVHFRKAQIFAIPGVLGTVIGSHLGLLTPSNNLLVIFAIFMIIVAIKTLIGKKSRKSENRTNDNNLKNISTSKDNVNKDTRIISNGNNGEKDQPIINQKINIFQLIVIGFLVGLSAGYFGIGGGFLIVPSLMHFSMNIVDAIGTSLLPVSLFGFTTAIRYSISNQVDWIVSLLFIIGGIVGGRIGTMTGSRISKNKLSTVFSILLVVVAIYILTRSFL